MDERRFRIVNVFTVGDDPFSGNPLCVFEDGGGLTDGQMLALARQFNLSETTFILPTTRSDSTARVRIFTPTFEMPFAGHPTLGTAYVVRAMRTANDHDEDEDEDEGRVALEMPVGLVRVTAEAKNRFTLRVAVGPTLREPEASRAEIAAMLGLPEGAVGEGTSWVNAGVEQLVIPLARPEDVIAARPNAALLANDAYSRSAGESMAYVWARSGESTVVARFFFLVHGGLVEDPATGSACANLGGWMLAHPRREQRPVSITVHQGAAIGRPSELQLSINADRHIFVSGVVREMGSGLIHL